MPSADIPFAKERIADVDSVPLRPDGRSRKVRVYAKGPERGIGPDTRILFHLHGLGGRQIDLMYKRFRRRFCDELDLLVLGIDYAGTLAMWNDHLHIAKEGQRLIEGLSATYQAMRAQLIAQKVDEAIANHARFWCTSNPMVAPILDADPPEDCWEYGAIQAVDVLAALRWVENELSAVGIVMPHTRPHLLAQSAGAQVAACLFGFAPNRWASLCAPGPMLFADENISILAALLTQPEGDVPTGNYAKIGLGEHPRILVLRKSPVLFPPSTEPSSAPVDYLDMRNAVRLAGGLRQHVNAVVQLYMGVKDSRVARPAVESVVAAWRRVGMQVDLVIVDEQMIDHQVFHSCEHTVCDDIAALWAREGPRIMGQAVDTTVVPWEPVRVATSHGAWHLDWQGITPSLRFEASP